MKTIKAHTHRDREKVVEQLIPLIQQELGSNFTALASEGSFARNEDMPYSDLELTAFVKSKKSIEHWEIREIVDGLLVVVVAETKDEYIQKYLDITDMWYASGAGRIEAIINADLIEELNKYKPRNIQAKCQQIIEKKWPHFQEITSKLLNQIETSNIDGIAMTFYPFMKELLILLAYLNQTPYKTLVSYLEQAKEFEIKPKHFKQTIHIFKQTSSNKLESALIQELYADLESIIGKRKIKFK